MVYLAVDELLEKNNKTKYWLAKNIGTDYKSINKWVDNQSSFIKLETIDKLCEVFNCEPKDIIKRD